MKITLNGVVVGIYFTQSRSYSGRGPNKTASVLTLQRYKDITYLVGLYLSNDVHASFIYDFDLLQR